MEVLLAGGAAPNGLAGGRVEPDEPKIDVPEGAADEAEPNRDEDAGAVEPKIDDPLAGAAAVPPPKMDDGCCALEDPKIDDWDGTGADTPPNNDEPVDAGAGV